MSSTNYTRIENTVVSGSALLSGLSGADINALNFQASLNRNPVITVTTANYALTVADLVQAAIDTQLVNGTGLTAARSLTLGTDSASQAAAYISLFGLTSTFDKVTLSFQADQGTNTSNAIALANTSGTANDVKILPAGGSASNTQTLFASAAVGGTVKQVEVTATTLTEGSEVVQFNVLATIG